MGLSKAMVGRELQRGWRGGLLLVKVGGGHGVCWIYLFGVLKE